MVKPLLFALPPETSHNLALSLLKNPAFAKLFCNKIPKHPELFQEIWQKDFVHPIGLSAGFDKNAIALAGLAQFGFSHIETGTVTPLAQIGNPKPRMFRFNKQQAIINRMGFNNNGLDKFYDALSYYQENRDSFFDCGRCIRPVIGANIGKNKLQEEPILDYITCLDRIYDISEYITINISSPNTEGLRDLQAVDKLKALLAEITSHCHNKIKSGSEYKPIFLKIAPDLTIEQAVNICDVAIEYNIDALIVSNTTISRPHCNSKPASAYIKEQGGLSGEPLFESSTMLLRELYSHANGRIKFIASGGVMSAEDAWQKIISGASLVQIYTGLIFKGSGIVAEIIDGLLDKLQQNGLENISQAIGNKGLSWSD